MSIEKFIEQFTDLFEESGELTAQTIFKNLSEWNSLMALSVLAMIDEEYDVSLKGQDIQNASTIEDLFKSIQSKMK